MPRILSGLTILKTTLVHLLKMLEKEMYSKMLPMEEAFFLLEYKGNIGPKEHTLLFPPEL